MEEKKEFKCFSRKLMYFLGVHDINYIDKFYHPTTGKPYWTFNWNSELTAVLTKWDEFKTTGKIS